MDDTLLKELLSASDDKALQVLINTHALDIEAVETLKVYSARFYYDNPAEAVRVAQATCRLGNLLPDPSPALGKWTLANALMFVDRYREAVELYEQIRTDYLSLDRPLDAARVGVGHVWALAYTGQFERALTLVAQVEPVLIIAAETDPSDHQRLGWLFNNAGIVYDLMGQYEEALVAYDRQLDIMQTMGNKLAVAQTQHNRARALTYLNAFDEARDAFQKAEQVFLEVGATVDLARLSHNRGTLYARWGRYAEAEAEFAAADEWLSSIRDTEQARATVAAYRALARLASGALPDEKLIDELTAAQTRLAIHGPLFEEGLTWLGLARCHLELDDLTAAQNAFERVLALAEQGGGRPLAWEALHYLGNLAERRADIGAAISFYEQAIAHIETVRRDLHVGAFRAGFLADKLTVYQDLALLYARLGRVEDAFGTVEQAKSRLLAEQLSSRLNEEIVALTASDDQVGRLAERLRDVLAWLEQLYRQARLDGSEERGGVWSTAPDSDTLLTVRQLEGEVRDLTREIERSSSSLSSLMTGSVASLPDVQAHLRDAVLLQYHIAHGQVRVFVVDGADIRTYRELAPLAQVEATRRCLSAAIERVLGLARHNSETLSHYLPSLLADAKAQLAALYDLLIRPIEDFLVAEVPLVISPDGPLHYVPFHALYDGMIHLVEQHVISYTPSVTVMDLCARRTATGEGILVLGYGDDSLPQITAEIETLVHLFPQATLLSEDKATAEQLLHSASRYHVLHLATHARFRTDNPMLSSLSLADRRLTLAEIAHLRLGAELITLSGCETGRGRLRGADLVSLAGGFLGAGARSLLVSLWRVDDATTARLMGAFYRALRGGAGRATALRDAQLDILTLGREQPEEHGFYRHPAYWAPFALIGVWDKLVG